MQEEKPRWRKTRRSTIGFFSVSSQIRKVIEADDGSDREHADFRRGEPVLVLALIEHDLQRRHPDDEQQHADLVDRLDDRRILVALEQTQAIAPNSSAMGTLIRKTHGQE